MLCKIMKYLFCKFIYFGIRLSIFWKLIHQILSICLKSLKISLNHLFQMFQCIFSVFKYSLLDCIK